MPTHVDTPIVGLYDVVTSAAFSAANSVPVTWTAGLYRRADVRVRVTSGATTYVGLALTGIVAVNVYYNSNLGIPAAGSVPVVAQALWEIDHTTTGGAPTQTKFDVELAAGAQRTMLAHAVGANGTGQISSGVVTDSATVITGVTVSFSLACSGWLEVLGFR